MDRMRHLTWEQYLSLCRKRETEGRKWISYDQAARQHRRPTSALRNRRSQSSTASRSYGPPEAGSLAPPLPAGRPRSRTPPRSISTSAAREVLFTESRRRLIPPNDSHHSSTDREEAFEVDRSPHRETKRKNGQATRKQPTGTRKRAPFTGTVGRHNRKSHPSPSREPARGDGGLL